MNVTATGVYVYAIVPTGEPLPRKAVGVGDPPAELRLISEGPVTAVVSDAPRTCARGAGTSWRTRTC